jgi:hypothetical protein
VRGAVQCCAVLCRAVPCCAVLCGAVRGCAGLCRAVPGCTVLCGAVQRRMECDAGARAWMRTFACTCPFVTRMRGCVAGRQARQFSRNGIKPVGDLSMWTDAPAERERKAKAAEARGWGAAQGGGGSGGAGGGVPMTLAEAVAVARENAAAGRRPQRAEAGGGGGGGAQGEEAPKAKSLVDLHVEQQATKKAEAKGKSEWEGKHPWKPWNRETDLDIRLAKPKGKESILNNQHMGTLGDRFGGGKKESTFM